MSEEKPFSVHAVQQKREQAGPTVRTEPLASTPRAARTQSSTTPVASAEAVGGLALPFDPTRLIAAVIRNWKWLPIGALVLLVPALLFGLTRFKTGYSVSIQMIRREVSASIKASQFGEAFKPRQVTVATVTSVMQSPKLLERVGSQAQPRLTASWLLGSLTIKPERDTDLINVTIKGQRSAQATADLANLYAKEVVALTAQMQSDEAGELEKFLSEQITKLDQELVKVNQGMLEFTQGSDFYGADREVEAYLRELSDIEVRLETAKATSATLDFRIASAERELSKQNPLALKLNQARDALARLKASYTDDNPQVLDAKDNVTAIEKESATATSGSNNLANFRYSENTVANNLYMVLLNLYGERESAVKDVTQLTAFHDRVKDKLKSVPEQGQRYAQIAARQQSLQATRELLTSRQREAQMFAENSPGLYRLFAKATAENVEVSSRWKKLIILAIGTAVFGFGLALLAICGLELMDLRVISSGDLKRATGMKVVARLADTTGWTAVETAQWRFRAWSQLLRTLQLQNAARVMLAFTSAREGEGKSTLIGHLRDAARDRSFPVVTVVNSPTVGEAVKVLSLTEALAKPELVTRELRERPSVPMELQHDPAWQWNLENRARWQRAIEAWQTIPALALLVELPAMSDLDSVLAAELMPAVIWVAASGESQQRDLAGTMKTVEAAEIHLAGAVLNREPLALARLLKLGKFGLSALVLMCALQSSGFSADSTNAVPPGQLSASSQTPTIAPWQERLTVGAGDIFNLHIYGRTETIRTRVPVGPDGRISFLEAQSVVVTGLTVDEMRARLDEILSKSYKNARTIITPMEWRSKHYYILGAVVDRGAYTLDQPLTIIEAVARARGIDTGLYEHNTVELADMTRSFIVRNNQRLPVDFERLFGKGDLSQNILIEPGDYLYFPSGTVNEVYLLGLVRNPGPLGLSSEKTLVGVLTVRGGFAPTAYKQRVLVVRGSLKQPQTFVVNVADILAGRAKDFELQPKDIIYVSEKPWQRAEDLLEMAVNSYVQAMTATWVGMNVKPLTTGPLLPQTH